MSEITRDQYLMEYFRGFTKKQKDRFLLSVEPVRVNGFWDMQKKQKKILPDQTV